ncbi:MAG: diguanylate cyclase [Acidobacteriia bacterium]|nr:diguanylate cyclase [Terriglobia bacterium]
MKFPGKDFQVLVVDDSLASRQTVEAALKGQPYTVHFAENGRQALQLYAEHLPHLVITDWIMPDIAGPDLCRRIRREFHGSYTYLILLTCKTAKTSVVEGLESGADDYLSKPFDPAELLARIAAGRRIAQMNREMEQRNRVLEQIAHTDQLTLLPNRRAVEIWTDRQLQGALRHGFPLWLVLSDLDQFKQVNDSHGHAAGDLVLKKYAELLKHNTRSADICGRLGGDEFIHVITHVPRGGIVVVVENLRRQLEELEFTFGGELVKVTASFGIAGLDGRKTLKFGDLLVAADDALYAVKRSGRNQIKLEEPVKI